MKWHEKITKTDMRLLRSIQHKIRSKKFDPLMKSATKIGSAGFIWMSIGSAMFLSKKYRRSGLVLSCTIAAEVFLNHLLVKNITDRPRPCDLDPVTPLIIRRPVGTSMPSGHTLTSVTAAAFLTKETPEFSCLAIPLAACISFSRMYLYVHYPSDVLVGALLGIGAGLSASQVDELLKTEK